MPEKSPLRSRSTSALFELKPLLDHINDEVEQPDYIPKDPVQFMHAFEKKHDQEIAGFLAATMAWGRRDIVVSKVDELMKRMQYTPFEFVMGYSQAEYTVFRGFKHRTFKPIDMHGLILTLQEIYRKYH